MSPGAGLAQRQGFNERRGRAGWIVWGLVMLPAGGIETYLIISSEKGGRENSRGWGGEEVKPNGQWS